MTPDLNSELKTDLQDEGSNVISLLISFAKRACFWSVVYSIGFYKWHIAWIILPLSLGALEKQWRLNQSKSKSRVSSSFDINSLPRWVFFPDTERAEWINKIITQIWPNLQNHVTDRLQAMISPEDPQSWLSKVKFSNTSIGHIPLQMGGIKVYKHNDLLRKEIIFDMEMILATDCDFCIKYLPFITASLRDLYLYGTIRVTLRPLLDDLPIVGGIEVSFLSVPYLDFDLGGLANVVDIPGVSRILRNIIGEQIAALCVMPKSLYIPLSYEEPVAKKSYEYEEVDLVRMVVRGARDLMGKDIKLLGQNTSDPYVTLTYGTFSKKSEVSMKTLDPQWNMQVEFLAESGNSLEIGIWDWNKITGGDFLGKRTLAKGELNLLSGKSTWIDLKEAKSGQVCLNIDYINLTSDISNYEYGKKNSKEGFCSAILLIYLDSARNLERNRKSRAPCPVVHFSISGRSPRPSSEASFTQNPIYEEEIRLLVPNPDCDDLIVNVTDAKLHCPLGYLKICLSEVLYSDSLEIKCQPFKFHQSDSTNGFLVMGMKLMFPKLL